MAFVWRTYTYLMAWISYVALELPCGLSREYNWLQFALTNANLLKTACSCEYPVELNCPSNVQEENKQ